jgi:hypothetical protein
LLYFVISTSRPILDGIEGHAIQLSSSVLGDLIPSDLL